MALLCLQTGLVLSVIVVAISSYFDVGFGGFHPGFMFTGDRVELQAAYPTWFNTIYCLTIFLTYAIPLAILFVFLRYRPWLSFLFYKNGISTADFLKNLLVFNTTLIISLVVVELMLRTVGYVPGMIINSLSFKAVDELQLIDGFRTDDNGVFKVDTAVVSKLIREYDSAAGSIKKWMFSPRKVNVAPELAYLTLRLNGNGENDLGENQFKERIRTIESSGAANCFDSLLVAYRGNPINPEGFYSIPFNAECQGKPKVLLLGDSFTWGHCSKDKTGSFANTLLARDLLVYNTGISGADMAQYMRILQTYLDSIDPDIVVLNFYIGNDVSYYARNPEPGVPLHFITNAGYLTAFQDSIQYRDAQSAYENIIRNMVIPKTTFVNRMLSKSVISTLIWKMLVEFRVIHHQYYVAPPRPEIPVCNQEMEQIQALCTARNKKFILSIIPNLVDGRLDGVASVPNLFPNIPYHEPQMSVDLFSQRDGHFNEEGHLFYADHLEKLILAAVGSE